MLPKTIFASVEFVTIATGEVVLVTISAVELMLSAAVKRMSVAAVELMPAAAVELMPAIAVLKFWKLKEKQENRTILFRVFPRLMADNSNYWSSFELPRLD